MSTSTQTVPKTNVMRELEYEVADKITALLDLLPLSDINVREVLEHIKFLRNSCAKGAYIQQLIASHLKLHAFIQTSLSNPAPNTGQKYEQVRLLLWQLLGNVVVNNKGTQKMIWSEFGDLISCNCVQPPLDRSTDIQLMILYNVFIGDTGCVSELLILRLVTQLWQTIIEEKCDTDFEFVHIFFENFIVNNRSAVKNYMQLTSEERIAFLDYLSSYLRNDCPNGAIGTFLLTQLSKEFKMKSDCIMRHSTEGVENMQPWEAYSLLRVIAMASGSEKYSLVYSTDHALFLNVSSLLRCLVAAGKERTDTIFTPLNKLEEVALTSNISHNFEHVISFELKTMLVRCVANLLYKNTANQGYCLDTQLIPALLECTNMDARNPLMREWSILALRNACMQSPEIQEVIANLTNQGTVENDILKDLNLKVGSLRIQASKK